MIRTSGSGVYCLGMIKDLILRSKKVVSGLKMNRKYKSILNEFIEKLDKKNIILEKRMLKSPETS